MGEKIKCYCCGNMTDKEKQYCQICGAELQYNWIEKQNKKIIRWLWIIFVSMMTSLITVYLATGSIGL